MVSTLKCAQALRQCQRLKTNIHGKSIEVADVLSEEFMQRQNLENLYKSVLLSDVQYALDNKVELELWNNVFKEHIDNFRLRIKEKKMNNEKNDIQAKLSLFLDVSTGFYFQLLQEFCDTYDLDLPYHGKASQIGIVSKPKKNDSNKPKINACLYVCQDCLVHLGDLARYRNDLQQAQTFYTLASKVLPGNGQPYNQLAILASAKGNNLQAVFYYFKSISVPNPFPAASSNLQKTLTQMCAKQNYNIFTKSSGITVPEFLELYLNFSGSIYLMQDISKINALKDQLLQDFKDVLLELTQLQLVHMMSVAIFNLQKCKHRNMELDALTEEDSNNWHVALLFCVQFMEVLLECTSEMILNQFQFEEMKCLPAIKLFTDWIICSGSNMLAQEAFQENSRLYYDLTVFANNLLTMNHKKEKSMLPLMEDWEMHGVNPFRKIHRRYDYRIQPVEVTVAQVWNIRVSRIFHFIDWLCQQEHMTQFLSKAEQNGKVEYICKQSSNARSPGKKLRENDLTTSPNQHVKVLQKPKNSSQTQGGTDGIFPHKSRSLFRTESEERHNMTTSVKGPVQSYSLFDTIWSRQSTPPQDSDTLSVGSPSVSLSSVGIFKESRPSIIHDPSPDIYGMSGGLAGKSEVARSLETPTYDLTSQLSNLSKPAQSPDFRHPVNQMSERMQGFQINSQPQISPVAAGHVLSSPTQPVPIQSIQSGMWFKSPQPGQAGMDAIPQHRPIPQPHPSPAPQQPQQRSYNSPLQQPFGSIMIDPSMIINNSFAKQSPNAYISHPFPPQPSNFGAIGQNIRATSTQIPSRIPSNNLMQNFGNNGQVPMAQRSWAAPPPPGIPDPMMESRSIWTSNFGIGQSEISPLEQLIKDQRRHQQPR